MISPKLFGEVRFSEHSYSNWDSGEASKQHGKVMMLVAFGTWNQKGTNEFALLGLATSKFPSSKSPFVANRICMFSQFYPENQWNTVPTLHLPVILRMRSASCTDGDGLRFSLSNWGVSFIPPKNGRTILCPEIQHGMVKSKTCGLCRNDQPLFPKWHIHISP